MREPRSRCTAAHHVWHKFLWINTKIALRTWLLVSTWISPGKRRRALPAEPLRTSCVRNPFAGIPFRFRALKGSTSSSPTTVCDTLTVKVSQTDLRYPAHHIHSAAFACASSSCSSLSTVGKYSADSSAASIFKTQPTGVHIFRSTVTCVHFTYCSQNMHSS